MIKNYNFRKSFGRYIRDVLAVLLILWGVLAVLTPFTPGSWLFFVGLFMIFGRKKTGEMVKKIIGKKLFEKFHLARFFKKNAD